MSIYPKHFKPPLIVPLLIAVLLASVAKTCVAQSFPPPPIEIGGIPDCPFESLGPFDGLYYVSITSCPPPFPASYAMVLMLNPPPLGTCVQGVCSSPLDWNAAAAAKQPKTIDEAIEALETLKSRLNLAYAKPLPDYLQKIVQKIAFDGTYLDQWLTYLNDDNQPDRLQVFNNEFPLAELENSVELCEGVHLPLGNSSYLSLPDRKVQVNLGSPVLVAAKTPVINTWLIRINTDAGPKFFKILWLEATARPGNSAAKRRVLVGYQVEPPPEGTPVIMGTMDSKNAYSHRGKFPFADQMLNFAATSVDKF
ncbi:MAG: hypothetical protein ABJZ55_06810 [Fuerstiella sp.]